VTGAASRRSALEKVRVVDFSWVRAGPWATRWLGALGAEVIKIEWPESERGRLPSTTTPQQLEVNLNTSGNFNDTNVNKKSLSLNVRSAKGLEVVKRLIGISDIVIENFSSRVLRNWGLGYEELCRIKPDIVYVSMSGYGHTGRNHHYTTFGPVAQAVSGLTLLSGLPDKPPAGWGWSYMDDTGGMYGAMCALTGLYHRNTTGRGQHIDLSQMVASIPLNGPALLDFTANGRGSRRKGFPPGNRAHWPGTPLINAYRGPTVAPHNAYRTDPGGYNDWCVIVCHNDEEWQRLVEVMGAPSWATSEKFAALAGRLQHQEELDQHIESWSMTLEKYQLTEHCQAAGVRALPVQSAEDRVEHDPQLRHRKMYLPMEHPALGQHLVQNAPFELSRTPARNNSSSPLIGQHTQELVEGLLGYSREELRAGFADGTFWPTSRPRFPYMEEMLR
jgi:crotonobetainyl-CoA:carnitine CoA-transferase CaiB-like acyl-CoA transferase